MADNEWIQVGDAQIQAVPLKKGVFIELALSPYDIPEAVRGRFDPKAKRFIIELRYLDSEPSEQVEVGRHALCVVGKYTKRIQAVKLDVDAMDVDHIQLKVERVNEAIDNLSRIEKSLGMNEATNGNYAVARKVVADRLGQMRMAAG